jgi:hypothetical protein
LIIGIWVYMMVRRVPELPIVIRGLFKGHDSSNTLVKQIRMIYVSQG